MEAKHFLTVEWCSNGERGIFCDTEGAAYSQEEPHTSEQEWEILDVFALILHPESKLLTEEEVSQYTYWRPLAEFSRQYGIALKEKPK